MDDIKKEIACLKHRIEKVEASLSLYKELPIYLTQEEARNLSYLLRFHFRRYYEVMNKTMRQQLIDKISVIF